MTFWNRVRGLFGIEAPEASDDEVPADVRAEGPERAEVVRDGDEVELERLGALPQLSSDERTQAFELFERIREKGREPVAIQLTKKLLASHAHDELRARLASVLDARGADDEARAVLAPLVVRADAPLHALMLAADLEERRGANDAALLLYERVVARDFDHPRARDRAQRLAEASSREVSGGATVMVEGALSKGRYRVTRELGRGGAGTVFLARDVPMGRDVALKVYHRRGRADRDRMLHEARVAASMPHPGVVRVLDVDPALGAIAMELLALGSVRSELGKGALPRTEALAWLASTVEALRFVHASGFVHRDLKPSNILIRKGNRVALTDFGIALRVGDKPAPRSGIEGTRGYMAPEQAKGAAATSPMDVHALGATLREVAQALVGGAPAALLEIASACTREDPRARPSLDQVAAVIASERRA